MQNNLNNLPNALIIGVQKSATTWLAKRLSQHPDIYMVREEIHYFDHESNFVKEPEWYASHFYRSTNEAVRCEKTPDYFWTTCEGVPGEPLDKPARIKQLLPNVKLIVILRNPVDRAISAWNHNVRSGAICPSFNINEIFSSKYSELVKNHGILSRGMYYQQLTSFLKYFSREQILVLFFETDVIKQPEEGLKKVAQFLEVDDSLGFAEISEPENKVTSTQLGVWGCYFSSRMFRQAINRVDKYFLTKLPLPKWLPKSPEKSVVGELYEYYYQENIYLSKLLGQELPAEWKYLQLK